MPNKARYVHGIYRSHEMVNIGTVRVEVSAEGGATENVSLASLPRQDLRRACVHIGVSGDMSRSNRDMVLDICRVVQSSTEWNGEMVKVAPFAGRSLPKATQTIVPAAPSEPAPSEPAVAVPTPTTSVSTSGGSLDDVIRRIAEEAVRATLSGWKNPLDEDRVNELITEGVERIVQRPIVRNIVVNTTTVATVTGRRHMQYEDVMNHILLGDELYLWGGAGAGKTTVISQIASDLGKRFELVTFSSQTTEAKLVGFRDATGEVRETPLVSALQEPSIVLFDEWDSCPPSVALTVNAVSANRMVSTPSGTYQVHPECVLVFSGNTNLDGATTAYNGRSATDFSSKDRVSVVEFLYDLDMERDLTIAELDGDVVTADKWLAVVRKVRANVLALGPTTSARIAITPRAAIKGARLLRGGHFSVKYVADARLRKGMDDRTWDQVRNGVPELA